MSKRQDVSTHMHVPVRRRPHYCCCCCRCCRINSVAAEWYQGPDRCSLQHKPTSRALITLDDLESHLTASSTYIQSRLRHLSQCQLAYALNLLLPLLLLLLYMQLGGIKALTDAVYNTNPPLITLDDLESHLTLVNEYLVRIAAPGPLPAGNQVLLFDLSGMKLGHVMSESSFGLFQVCFTSHVNKYAVAQYWNL